MVKVDASRNYYADLGVGANADENEIRKAFRTLALKCHPDRNPGREQESVVKFQQIQAANEVLSDPVQRLKYDNERRKFRNLNIPPYNPNTPRARPPPPSRAAYTTTTTPSGSYYRPPPPKPRPQAPPAPQRPPPPQQHQTTYANGADRFASKTTRAPPTAKKGDAKEADAREKANVFQAWQKMKQPRADEARPPPPPNPNNPNGAPFGRTKSTRMPSARAGFDPGTPGGDEGQARSSYRSHYERPNPSPSTEDPFAKLHREYTAAADTPFAEGNRYRTPYSSAKAGERTSMFGEGASGPTSMRNSPTGSSSYSDFERRPQRNSFGGHTPSTKKAHFPHMYDTSDEDDADDSGRKHRGPPPPKDSPQQQQSAWSQGLNGTSQQPKGAAENVSPSAFKSRSEESINMKFSPADWHGKFEGKPDYFAPNVNKGGSNKGRTSPTRGRNAQRTTSERYPFSGSSQPPPPVSPFSTTMPPPPPPPGPPPTGPSAFANGAASAPHTAKFAPEAWKETFKEPTWAYPSKGKETSPRRGSAAAKRPPPPRKASVAPEASTRAGAGEGPPKAKYQAFAEPSGGDAMDIDDDLPPATQTKVSSAPPGRPTLTPRAKSTGTNIGKPPGGQAQAESNPPATAPSATGSTAQLPSPGFNGLANLATVEPFLPATDGLAGDLSDLKTNLPFPSQPSSAHPTKPNTAQKLHFPLVPLAPQPPQRLDAGTVEAYFIQFEAYARKYNKYAESMTRHFVSRHAELADGGLEERFVSARGEGSTRKVGFAGYARRMREDEEVLAAWGVAMERHVKALEGCEEVRRRAAKMRGAVA